MKIFKEIEDIGIRLDALDFGDLFEKDCSNPCATYMVASKTGFQIIGRGDDGVLVVDLKNALVRYLPAKTKVIPLETEGLTVNEKS